jgi:hypothetical protein
MPIQTLFDYWPVSEELERRRKLIATQAAALTEEDLLDEDAAVARLVSSADVRVPQLARDQAQLEVLDETPMEVVVSVPFTGDDYLFNLKPSMANNNPPTGSINRYTETLQFLETFTPDTPSNEVQEWAGQAADRIEQYLGWLQQDVAEHRQGLEAACGRAVAERKEQLDSVSSLRNDLGGGI